MMKTKFQKWIAALISFVMIGIIFSMLPMTSLTVSAICCRKDGFDKSRYTLTGNMAEDVATIAKSQKGRTGAQLGYTEAWCDEYVADCIENAGADSSIVGHGGTVADFESVMRKKGAVPVSSPQTGDLVFFTYSHVEIVTKVENGTVYCAGGNNGGTGNYKTNYCAGERKLYATPRLYLRPNYSRINPDPPSYSNLQVNKSLIFVGEEITFTASSDTATGFTIGIDNETSRYITQEMPNGSLTLTFNEPGQYGAYVTSYNPYGYCDSSWIPFTVAAPVAPSYSNLQANKSLIFVGEEITFTASSDTATGFTIGIDNETSRYITQEMPNGSLTLTFNEPGQYGAYVTSYNPYGYCDSSWIPFTVAAPVAPSYSNLQANRSIISVGEEITFTASSDIATSFLIGIDNETSRYITQEMPNGSLTLTFNEPGQYGAYVTSYNPYGYCDSSWISFTVAAPVNLGDNFYARIKNQSSGWYFTNNNGNVEGQEAIDSDSQIWKFERQSDGSYKIFSKIDGIMDVYASAKDGNATNVQLWSEHGGNNQKYYIYRLDDAYYIKPLCTDLVVDMALNEYPGNVAVWAKGDDWAPQKFDIIKQIKGDLNGDTNITLTDLIPLQKHLLLRTNLTTEQSALADLNSDGMINVIDLMLLKRTLLNP